MRCVDDDIFVSDQGWGTYNDEKGQEFLRASEEAAIARAEARAKARAQKRPYSPDYESTFYVRPVQTRKTK